VKRLVVGGAAVALLVWGSTFLRKGGEEHEHKVLTPLLDVLKTGDEKQVIDVLHHLAETRDAHAVDPVIELIGRKPSDAVLQAAAETLAKLDATKAVPALKEAAGRDLDPDLQLHLAQAILDLKDPSGFVVILKILESSEVPGPTRDEALELVQKRTGRKMDLAELKKWWAEKGAGLKWRSDSRRFE
jgi:thioredoxin-like negative regulator of GroEL